MSPEYIGLLLIIGYLGWKLFGAISKEDNAVATASAAVKNAKIPASIAYRMQKPKVIWDDDEFLQGAKIAFHMISSAFANGKKKELKIMLAPQVYDTFVKEIDDRESKKQRLDFSLICVNSAKILKKAEAVREVTVQFISEQVNILKDEQGNAIEGDPMNVSVMCDTWTFRKKKNDTWIVCATKSEANHA
ncbi:MAG: Tim44/TimA family putative adaptor protein [Alphaproteobacteria bacterium]|nr:Tim44/TimA family putative adaptor protein [Alphaproteobacteria bacterium]